MVKRQIIGGNFQDPLGNPVALGYLTIRLNQDGVASDSQISAGFLIKIPLDINGNIAGTVDVWPNDQITPTTVYFVDAYTASGENIWSNQQVIPSGAGSFDIGTWIPNNT